MNTRSSLRSDLDVKYLQEIYKLKICMLVAFKSLMISFFYDFPAKWAVLTLNAFSENFLVVTKSCHDLALDIKRDFQAVLASLFDFKRAFLYLFKTSWVQKKELQWSKWGEFWFLHDKLTFLPQVFCVINNQVKLL